MNYNNFITIINDPYQNNLATRNPQTINDIKVLLQNDFQYLKSDSKTQNIPFQRFASKQQISNAQNMKPTPMSTQTKQTFQPRQNFRPNNYFAQQNRRFDTQKTNYIAAEINYNEHTDAK